LLAEQGIRTTVLMPDESGNAAEQLCLAGIDVVQMSLRRVRASKNALTHCRYLLGLPFEINHVRKLIRDFGVDIVQINGLANPHGALAARAAGVPVVWQILDTYTPLLLRRALAPLLKHCADV